MYLFVNLFFLQWRKRNVSDFADITFGDRIHSFKLNVDCNGGLLYGGLYIHICICIYMYTTGQFEAGKCGRANSDQRGSMNANGGANTFCIYTRMKKKVGRKSNRISRVCVRGCVTGGGGGNLSFFCDRTWYSAPIKGMTWPSSTLLFYLPLFYSVLSPEDGVIWGIRRRKWWDDKEIKRKRREGTIDIGFDTPVVSRSTSRCLQCLCDANAANKRENSHRLCTVD